MWPARPACRPPSSPTPSTGPTAWPSRPASGCWPPRPRIGYAGPARGRDGPCGWAATGAVALARAGSVEDLLADPASVLVARGLARACDRAGHALLLAGGANSAADGAVVLGDARSWSGGGPVVAVGGPAPEGVPCVRARLGAGAAAAARHLADLGHARLAVIGPPGTGERLEGAREGWGRAGALVSYEAVGSARADGEVAAGVALGARPRPTALLALTDRLAWGALDAARRLGIEVPLELSVAGIDDLAGSQALRLTSVFVPYLPMGELAGGLRLALMAG